MIVKVTDKRAPDTLVVPLAQGSALPDMLAEIAQRAGLEASALQNDFRAEAKEVLLLYASTAPGRRFYLVGLGSKYGFAEMQSAMRSFSHRYKAKLPARLGVDMRYHKLPELPRLAEAALSGLLLGLYDIGQFRSDASPKTSLVFGSDKSEANLVVAPEQLEAVSAAARRAELFAAVLRGVFDLGNTPGNHKTPQILAQKAQKMAETNGFSVQVLEWEALKKQGLEALCAVGKGSPHPPLLLWLEYGAKTRKAKTPVFGLVGKGVTFDTGGVSLKPSNNMHLMKSDLGGAAAVLGAFAVAAQLQLPVRLIGAIPVAENMIDGNALKPGDVIGSCAGKTIEVTDTDAEGRLILADALAFLLKQENPDVLLDLATLTGSIIRAIGTHAAGLFSKNDALAAALAEAGDACGERLWRMPLWDEYGSDLKSDVADLRNYTGKPMAESISAAKFIEHFTQQHDTWAHLDIAGTAFADSEFAQSKSATGYGVRLLVEFMEQWGAQRMAAQTETP
jgi:leucyl aminopeptidase